MQQITRFFETINYVYLIEIIVIIAIIVFLLFVFYQLGLLKKEK